MIGLFDGFCFCSTVNSQLLGIRDDLDYQDARNLYLEVQTGILLKLNRSIIYWLKIFSKMVVVVGVILTLV